MKRFFLSVAVACLALTGAQIQARMTADVYDGRLVVTSGEVGTESFGVVRFGGFIVLYVDGEFYGAFDGVRSIIFNGDDDVDIFINNTELGSIQYGGGGDDILIGGAYRDRLYGDDGVDYLDGKGENDWLDPGPDLDDGVVLGGEGDDVLIRNRYKENSPFSRYTLRQGFRTLDLGGDPMDEIRTRSALLTSYGIVIYLP